MLADRRAHAVVALAALRRARDRARGRFRLARSRAHRGRARAGGAWAGQGNAWLALFTQRLRGHRLLPAADVGVAVDRRGAGRRAAAVPRDDARVSRRGGGADRGRRGRAGSVPPRRAAGGPAVRGAPGDLAGDQRDRISLGVDDRGRAAGAGGAAPAGAPDRVGERRLCRREPVAGGLGPSQGPNDDRRGAGAAGGRADQGDRAGARPAADRRAGDRRRGAGPDGGSPGRTPRAAGRGGDRAGDRGRPPPGVRAPAGGRRFRRWARARRWERGWRRCGGARR